jgi:molybdopterin/thiamine biosynthesis adenylyltransferase
MSLANFFDKAALGAATVLKGFDLEAFASALSTHRIDISIDSNTAGTREANVALELSTNLLARFYPSLTFSPSGEAAKAIVPKLINLARSINPEIELGNDCGPVTASLVFGSKSSPGTHPKVYVGSNGWIARISSEPSVSFGDSSNPFGACAAACLGVANVFRYSFAEQLDNSQPDRSLSLSLIDLDPNNPLPPNPPLEHVELLNAHLVGIGAIGNGAVWALKKVPDISGTLCLIDHEEVELSNLQRYILTSQSSVGKSKVSLAGADWKSRLSIKEHQLRWADYVGGGCERLEQVAVALDSAADRCEVQASLPRWIINSWTRGGNLGVSRHSFNKEDACLMCLYLPESVQKNEDQIIADAIGLPESFREVRELLHRDAPVTGELLKRISEALGIEKDSLAMFEGKRLRSFYSQAICGGHIMRLTKGARTAPVEVPMAFQSALAGVLLAAELVIHNLRLRKDSLPTVTQMDLLKPIGSFLSVRSAKDRLGRCICQDQDYLAAFSQNYPDKESRRSRRRVPNKTLT